MNKYFPNKRNKVLFILEEKNMWNYFLEQVGKIFFK
jgi:hypothetical protein